MLQLAKDLEELDKLISAQIEAGSGLSTPALEELGFTEKEVTEADRTETGCLQSNYLACWRKIAAGYEITVLDREWDRSRVYQVRPDGIEVTVIVRGTFRSRWIEKA